MKTGTAITMRTTTCGVKNVTTIGAMTGMTTKHA
jgi:hypothetical protein